MIRRSHRRAATAASSPDRDAEQAQPRKRLQRTRASARGIAGFTSLADRIVNRRENVVFITGAGLSAASGVRPFRTSGSAKKPATHRTAGLPPMAGLWDEVIWTTATRACFRKDPLRWYNEFWIPHFRQMTNGGKGGALGPISPNPGHFALGELLKEFANVRQITQNIDSLQSPREHLIEAHGRIGLYKVRNNAQMLIELAAVAFFEKASHHIFPSLLANQSVCLKLTVTMIRLRREKTIVIDLFN